MVLHLQKTDISVKELELMGKKLKATPSIPFKNPLGSLMFFLELLGSRDQQLRTLGRGE